MSSFCYIHTLILILFTALSTITAEAEEYWHAPIEQETSLEESGESFYRSGYTHVPASVSVQPSPAREYAQEGIRAQEFPPRKHPLLLDAERNRLHFFCVYRE